MIGHIEKLDSESWVNLPWKQFRRDLFRLQKRTYKAVREGDTAKAQSLQKLIMRSIPIPKKDGSKRILKVPTISDRAWQCLAKFALEPAHEAGFHERSYGFRPGRSAHDAQKILFLNLSFNSKGYEKRVIELDISKCFD